MHPHDKFACLEVVEDFGSFQDPGGVYIRVAALPSQGQTCTAKLPGRLGCAFDRACRTDDEG